MPRSLQHAWRRLRAARRPVVIVSGLPRSGTSMMMRMLAAGGLEILTAGERRADEDNPEGYFELERVKGLVEGDTAWIGSARGRAVKVVSSRLVHLPDRHRDRVIFMRRDPTEILASQRRMLTRRGEDDGTEDEALLARFAEHLDTVTFLLRHDPRFETEFIDYRSAIEDPRAAAERVAAFVGAGLDVSAMAAAVDPRLYRNRCRGEP